MKAIEISASSLGTISGLSTFPEDTPASRVPEILLKWDDGKLAERLAEIDPRIIKRKNAIALDWLEANNTRDVTERWIDKACRAADPDIGLSEVKENIQREIKLRALPIAKEERVAVDKYINFSINTRRGTRLEDATLDRFESDTGLVVGERNVEVRKIPFPGLNDPAVFLKGKIDGQIVASTKGPEDGWIGTLIELKNRMRRVYQYVSDKEKLQCLSYLFLYEGEEVRSILLLQALWSGLDNGNAEEEYEPPPDAKCKIDPKELGFDPHLWRKASKGVKRFVRNIRWILARDDLCIQFLSKDTSKHEELWERVSEMSWSSEEEEEEEEEEEDEGKDEGLPVLPAG